MFFSEIWIGNWPNLLYEIQSSIWNILFVFQPRVTYKIQWISRHPSSEKLIKFCKRDQEFRIERTSFWSDLHRRLKIEGLRNSYFFSDLNESLHTSVKMNSESTLYEAFITYLLIFFLFPFILEHHGSFGASSEAVSWFLLQSWKFLMGSHKTDITFQ